MIPDGSETVTVTETPGPHNAPKADEDREQVTADDAAAVTAEMTSFEVVTPVGSRDGSGRERLLRNARAAGVGDRVTVQAGDMRALPFPAASFDAVVSAYAMDHLRRDGADAAVKETARVLRPGGTFLLEVVRPDAWAALAYGPMFFHHFHPRPERWIVSA